MASGGPNTQTIHIPLDGGIDQRTARHWVQSPAVLDSVNTRFRQVGGVEKRPGCELVADTIGGAAFVGARGQLYALNDKLVATDMHSIGALRGDDFVGSWPAPEASPSSMRLTSSMGGLGINDVILSSGDVLFTAWTSAEATSEAGRLVVQATDPDDGTLLTSAWFIDPVTVVNLRLATLGTDVILFYAESGSALIKYVRFDGATGIASSSGTLVSDSIVNAGFDLIEVSGSLYLIYVITGNSMRARQFNSSLVNTATVNLSIGAGQQARFSASHSSGTLWAACVRDTGTDSFVRAAAIAVPAMTLTTAMFTAYTVPNTDGQISCTAITALSATTAMVAFTGWSIFSGAVVTDITVPMTMAPVVNTSGTVSPAAAARVNWWTQICGRPFIRDGKTYGWVYTGGTRFSAPTPPLEQRCQFTLALVDYGTGDTSADERVFRPVCWTEARSAYFGPVDQDTHAQGSAIFRAGHAANSLVRGTKNSTLGRVVVSADGRAALTLVTADYGAPNQMISCTLGRSLMLSPGWYWDGRGIGELSFCYWPQSLLVDTYTTGGGLVAGQSYRWRVCYVFIDATGDVHRSQPSDYVEGTASDTSATLLVPTLCLTGRQRIVSKGPPGTGGGVLPEILIEVYRTKDTAVDPNTYYLVAEGSDMAIDDVFSPYATIVDVRSDDEIATHRQLYTLGGVRPNVQPSGFTALTPYRNRVWIAYGNTVAYSKAYVTGDAVSFTDAFTLPLEESGDITALWVQDDTLFISTDERIYYLQGDGPNDLGNLNDIGTPNRVATDRGVSEPRSIATGPLGTYYQSRVGIQLLDRGRNVSPEPVGARVQDTLGAFPTITSALVHPTGSYVTFTCSNGSANTRLVLDYTADKWSRDEVLAGTPVITSSVNLGGDQYFLAGGAVYRETPAACLDAGAWVAQSVTVAEQHPAGPQGNVTFLKWTVLAERYTARDLTASWYRDYASASFETQTRDSSKLTAVVEQASFNPAIHRAQSMRMRIADATPTGGGAVGTGQGATLMALAIELEPIDKNTFRLAASQKG